MTALVFVSLAAAGGLGAAARYALDAAIGSRLRTVFPWATFIINVSGSLALGLVTALASGHLLPQEWALIVGSGFLGGYTTFSTTSYETIRLLREGRHLASLGNSMGTLAVTICGAALGYWFGSRF